MEYTEEEILFIESEKPEFRRKPIPSLDAVIVEFLKKYEVYVQPVSSGTRNTAENAVSGAITGMFGADVGGDAFMISGQNKQTKIQEWTQWKQWALDHKDFEAFKVEKIDEIKKYNDEIPKKLKDPAIQKQLEPLLEELRKENELENIEKEMKRIAKSAQNFTRSEITKKEAVKIFKNRLYKGP